MRVTDKVRAQFNTEALSALSEEYSYSWDRPTGVAVAAKAYEPPLAPTQKRLYDSNATYILAHAERCSGKTWSVLHKLVKHCYDEPNALAIIIVGVKRQAEEGGAWHKLLTEVLPAWESGMGFNHDDKPFYTDPKSNSAKDIFLWIRNKSGLLSSRVLLLSMPVEGFVADRVKGIEASFIMVDEAQTLESDTYFRNIVQQVGRRRGIKGVQQIVYCCNPAGPSHWLYKRFFIDPIDKVTGKWDDRYAEFHVPIQENSKNLQPGYWENVLEAVRGDPVEEARLVRGEWVDRPEGNAIFADVFSEARHVRGDRNTNRGLLPIPGHPIILGYDPGAAHTSIHFMQVIPTLEKIIWMVFDELNYVGAYKAYCDLVPKIVERMVYWEHRVPHRFIFQHISDNSAFNQYRAKEGSFDAWDIEKISAKFVEDNKLDPRYIIKLQECPKGAHSIEARVRLVRDALYRDELLISATCPKTKEMFMRLEEDEKERLKPQKGSTFGHPFDSLSYPIFFYNVGRGRWMLEPKKVMPELYTAGR